MKIEDRSETILSKDGEKVSPERGIDFPQMVNRFTFLGLWI
jgi:hypothetical protein